MVLEFGMPTSKECEVICIHREPNPIGMMPKMHTDQAWPLHVGKGLLRFKAGLSLARLLQSRDRPEEAYDVLKLGLELLHEGFDIQAVHDAQGVLKGLARADVR